MRYIFLLLLLFPVCASALEIKGLEIDRISNGEHLSLLLSGRADYDISMSDDTPTRLIIDLPAAKWHGKVALPGDYEGLIENVRFLHRDAKGSRVVFSLADGVVYDDVKITRKKNAYALEMDLIGNVVSIFSRKSVANTKRSKHEKSERHEKKSGRPVIVIDAGHGGQDEGTSGYNGSREKDLTLDYATALKEALQDTGRYNVVLTRSDDRYLFLKDRVKRARDANGNLFISIHADSSPVETAQGLSVYTISETASDKQSEALAEKENKADIIGGMDLSVTSKDVADILIDLTQRETRAKSIKFADMLVKSFHRNIKLLNHTHRFAGFAVLKAPDIPSVLIEVGFLTNPHEEHLLHSDGYQDKFLHDVVKAIDTYFAR